MQRMLIQRQRPESSPGSLRLAVVDGRPIPQLASNTDVLVRVTAAGLNPVDYKMVSNFFMEEKPVGCDFVGIVERAGSEAGVQPGARVVGLEFPYRPENQDNGAFAQYLVTDGRRTALVPDEWSDTKAAALASMSWATVGLAMSKPDALALTGKPSAPAEKAVPVLVYGAGTATGHVAIQMLKQSGYLPIAVCSEKSAARAIFAGAVGAAYYTSPNCVEQIQKLANGVPIKHALDCITQRETVEICFASLARIGARYACLEVCPEAWRPRRSVHVNVVMAYEQLHYDVDFGHTLYARKSNPVSVQIGRDWIVEIQGMMKNNSIEPLPAQELGGTFERLIAGLEEIHGGQVRGKKLVCSLP